MKNMLTTKILTLGIALTATLANLGAMTLLEQAIFGNSIQAVQQLINQGIPLDTMNVFNNIPLHFAVQIGHYEVAAYLLANGADVNQPNSAGMTALHFAATNANLALVQLLIAHNATIYATNLADQTPLQLAPPHTAVYELLTYFATRGQQAEASS